MEKRVPTLQDMTSSNYFLYRVCGSAGTRVMGADALGSRANAACVSIS